jgi:hypothetical protein
MLYADRLAGMQGGCRFFQLGASLESFFYFFDMPTPF